MRTDYYYAMPEPSDEVRDWVEEHVYCGVAMDALSLRSDLPDFMRDYVQRMDDSRQDWEDGAKDRPITYDLSASRFRLFDGPWLSLQKIANALGTFVFADPGGMLHYEDLNAVYRDLIDAGDETLCRRIAAAFYERIDMHQCADRMLGALCREAREKQNGSERVEQAGG